MTESVNEIMKCVSVEHGTCEGGHKGGSWCSQSAFVDTHISCR